MNPVFCRFKFNNEVQGDRTIEQFITTLKTLARDCKFSDEEDMIRDRLVFGVRAQKVRERLINEGEKLTMDKAIEISQNFEYSQQQLKSMSESSTAAVSVHAVQSPKPSTSGANRTGRQPIQPSKSAGTRESRPTQRTTNWRRQGEPSDHACGKCGQKHSQKARCPAQGKQCHQCKKWNHFSVRCRSKTFIQMNRNMCSLTR